MTVFPLVNTTSARKIGPCEVLERINDNTYMLKLPSHIKTSDIFNVRHLIPYQGDSSEDDLDLRSSSFSLGETEADHVAENYFQTFEHPKRNNK